MKMGAITRRRLPDEKWIVVCCSGEVVISPPRKLLEEFDGLFLEITGNMDENAKVKIGNIVCDKLNA
jgi:hypothetical protein